MRTPCDVSRSPAETRGSRAPKLSAADALNLSPKALIAPPRTLSVPLCQGAFPVLGRIEESVRTIIVEMPQCSRGLRRACHSGPWAVSRGRGRGVGVERRGGRVAVGRPVRHPPIAQASLSGQDVGANQGASAGDSPISLRVALATPVKCLHPSHGRGRRGRPPPRQSCRCTIGLLKAVRPRQRSAAQLIWTRNQPLTALSDNSRLLPHRTLAPSRIR